MVARKITVIQMVPELDSGGVETGTLDIAACLTAHGHRSVVISGGGALEGKLHDQGSRHLKWPHVGEKSPRCLKYILPLKRLLITEKADILHLRSRLPAWIGYAAWKLLPKESSTRLVTTFHGFYSVNAYSRIMTRGEKIIAVSKGIARHMEDTYNIDSRRIEIIHRGIDLDRFSPDSVSPERVSRLKQAWEGGTPGRPIIMLPARMTRLKGHAFFIKALAPIRHLNWQAVCVGGRDRNSTYGVELASLIKATGLDGRITFPGECSDMPAAYKLADIVVSASTHPESFGRIAVEAQAMGKIIIATAHGGSLETVLPGRGGILVKPDHVEELSRALAEAINRLPLDPNSLMETRSWVANRFSLERMCRDTLGLYNRMLKQEPSR